MKFYCQRDIFIEGISYVQKAIANRTNVSILSGMLLEVTDKIKLTGYDLEQSIEYTFDADIKKTGEMVIEVSFFGDLLRRSTDPLVEFEADENNNITLTCGKSVFHLKGISSEAYPKLPDIDGEKAFNLPRASLKNLIKQTIFAISDDQTRKNLMGCFFTIKDQYLDVVGIDGFRMAIRRFETGETGLDDQFIVLGKHLKDLMSILDDVGEVQINYSKKQIVFSFGKIRMICRLVQENVINYNGLIPHNFKTSIVVNTKDFLSAMERASLMSFGERKYPASLYIGEEILEIKVQSTRGKFNDQVNIDFTGEKVDLDFNPRFLVETLKNIEDEKVLVKFSGELGPMILQPAPEQEDGKKFLYLILPLRK